MTTALASAPVRDDLKVGGHYTARDNGDGTFDILDVCVFAEIPAGVKRNQKPIGREWQEAALMQSKAREAGGHLPPVHIYHSDEVSVKPSYAGKFRLRSVRQGMYEGKRLWMTFADILGVPAEVFARIKKGFLPYRSVEVHNWDKTEIDSLALMDTDVPFFRMPMLTVGSVLHKDAELSLDRTRPSVAFRLGKKEGGAILFRFAERGNMAAKDEDDDKDKDKGKGLNAAPMAEKLEPPAADEKDLDVQGEPEPAKEGPGGAEMEGDPNAAPEGHAEPDGDEAAMAPGEGEGDKPVTVDLGPVMSMMQNIGTMMKQILERLGPQPQTEEKHEAVSGLNLGLEAQGQDFKDEGTKEIDMAGEKDPGAGKVSMSSEDLTKLVSKAASEAVLKATAPMLAEMATLKAKGEAEAKQSANAARFAAAKKELADNGQHVDAELEKVLLKSAEHGEDFLKDQVAVLKSRLPKDPPADGDAFEASLTRKATEAVSDDEINTFCSEHGPQHAPWAKKQMAQYRAWQQSGSSDMTAEEWLATNFRSASMFERNKV